MWERFASWLGERFGPERGLSVYVLMREYVPLVIGIIGSALVVWGIVSFFIIEPNRHAGYEKAVVKSVLPRPSTSGSQKWVLEVTLASGGTVLLGARESGSLMGIAESVCVEKRVSLTSDRSWYKLVPNKNCAPEGETAQE